MGVICAVLASSCVCSTAGGFLDYHESPKGQVQRAQTDWLGFCKGVRTYEQRAFLMELSRETGEKAIPAALRGG